MYEFVQSFIHEAVPENDVRAQLSDEAITPPTCGFEPNRRNCVVSLKKKLYPLLSTGSTQEDDYDERVKQTK